MGHGGNAKQPGKEVAVRVYLQFWQAGSKGVSAARKSCGADGLFCIKDRIHPIKDGNTHLIFKKSECEKVCR